MLGHHSQERASTHLRDGALLAPRRLATARPPAPHSHGLARTERSQVLTVRAGRMPQG